MRLDINNIEQEWIISALEHYVEDCKTELAETDSQQFQCILQLAIDGRNSLIAKIKKKAAH